MTAGLKIGDIQNLIDNDGDEKTVSLLKIFWAAMNDWPTPVLTLDEYLNQIEVLITNVPTRQSLEHFLNSCNLLQNAWQVESITGVLEVYHHYNDNLSLREIITDVQNKINQKL